VGIGKVIKTSQIHGTCMHFRVRVLPAQPASAISAGRVQDKGIIASFPGLNELVSSLYNSIFTDFGNSNGILRASLCSPNFNFQIGNPEARFEVRRDWFDNWSQVWSAGRFLMSLFVLSASVVASAALGEWFGETGIIVVATLAGLVDTHSAAISVASLVASGKMSAADAVSCVVGHTLS
jgi:hypothetical protein